MVKSKFHYFKYLIDISNGDIDEIIVKKNFKYFIGYKYDEKVKPLLIMLPKMTGYENIFNESNYKSVLIKIKSLLKYFDKILDKVSNIIKKDLIANKYIMKNILEIKQNLMKVKSIQVFMIMECIQKALIVFVY